MGLLDNVARLTGNTNSDSMGQAVDEMVQEALTRRKAHERRWYDNNFFDDGYHFRVISKKTGRVIDTVNKTSGYVERAIPRASRQIRGVSNLLFAAEPYPVVYPERINKDDYDSEEEYQQALENAKKVAKKQGIWLSTEWDENQELPIKLIDGILKAAKNSVSWVQIYSDPKGQKLITDVHDAFDVICFGDKDDERKLPFITKAKSMDIEEVKASPMFSEAKVAKLKPDNKYATSEIKDAYMRSRYGSKEGKDLMVLETYIKEYLSEDNWKQAVKLGSDTGAMEGKSKGDMIMRQLFSVGGVTLDDAYVDYDEYPLVPIRFEPGPLYQTPFIERFIPQNKSLDVIVTRLEKWVNTMVVGVYTARKGENFEISNFPGGQKIEYETTPPAQMNQSSAGATPFQVVELLNNFIEEQGASTAALNQLPSGVKSGVAIEQVKATEYANLKIPTLMLKQSIKRISERMLERADKDFLEPVEVSSVQDGEPEYFDVIGQRGLELSQQVNKDLPSSVVPISRKSKVRIEIEPGLGLTMAGKKEAMQSIIDYMLKLYEGGFIAPEALQQVIKKFLETFGYGSTEEFMDAMENGVTGGQMTEQQIKQMQIALIKTLKDAGMVGPQADQKLVTASKLGTLESLKDAGLIDKMSGDNGEAAMVNEQEKIKEMVKIYKDSPPDIRRQIESELGMVPSDKEEISPVQADTASKISGVANNQKDPVDVQQDRELKDRDMSVKEQLAKQKAQQTGGAN